MSLTDAAIGRIKAMIVDGELLPGDRLPKEADLAERLGISRSSLREAVKALELVNVLDVRRGDGTYVTSLEPPLLLEAMSFAVDLHGDDTVLEFLEVRRLLEPAATAMAATRMDDAGLAALRASVDALGDSPGVDALVAADLAFHRTVVAAAGNAVLTSLLDSLAAPTQRARLWRGLTQRDAVSRTIDEHHAICAALEARDPELARAAATMHIGGVELWLRSQLDAGADPGRAAGA